MNLHGFRSNFSPKQDGVIFIPKQNGAILTQNLERIKTTPLEFVAKIILFYLGVNITPFRLGGKITPFCLGIKITNTLFCLEVKFTQKTLGIHWTSILPHFLG